jgi:hypothetical protein
MMAAGLPSRRDNRPQDYQQPSESQQNDFRPTRPRVLPGFGLPKPRRPGPVDLAWNWRWEIGTFAALAYLTTKSRSAWALPG